MIRSDLFHLGALVVLIFGLISCTRDDAGPGAPFTLSPPSLNGESVLSASRGTSQATVRGTDLLRFQGSEVTGVSLLVDSECRLGERVFLGQQRFMAQPEMSLLSLLPRSLSYSPLAPTERAECRVHFTATNSNGSKHRFRLGPFYITHINDGDSVVVERNFEPQLRETPATRWPRTVWKEMSFAANEPLQEAILDCEGFVSRIDVAGLDRVRFTDFRLPTAYHPSSITSPVLAQPSPMCRFRGRGQSGAWYMSSLFQLEFTHPRLKLTRSRLTHMPLQHHQQQPLLTLEIRNEDDHSWIIAVPKKPTAVHPFQLMARSFSGELLVYHGRRPLLWTITRKDAEASHEDAERTWIELRPRQELHLRALLTPPMQCQLPYNSYRGEGSTAFGLRVPSTLIGAIEVYTTAQARLAKERGTDSIAAPATLIPLAPDPLRLAYAGMERFWTEGFLPEQEVNDERACR